ncbi:tRNA (adenosine(37)-N6)-threonylcarbamoyltransferase complex dimerization subunit type 1 TsaB [candidate division KSB1 bacterium]|nr:tRNA (adenosine(37)-N6)-threonylcarbamoyltransferase complex dimerization subunit type 1 TsaB [candidate division KSB1 bacterium]NIS26035.1 tRNA (adenosine(37)-N6)-threonylcarbamoyltransferase complex dimerization subunit type 1 TsaB [candidate division KSB1 bacterium]NIU26700.1 tRNA (adenosine(37)-N6)-threonylcarbamoyltransferase complex dimerization subunit type 1 TsaB [candidate division KSB1 bacterium]NIV94139.1 tRNA (adenosine(37)-N6)-threonylcarbamoyltransferase complex dimerization sub
MAIDTATQACGLALTEDNRLVAEYRLIAKNIHNEQLVIIIEHLTSDARWHLTELSGIVFSMGPGSFTGLRIGLAVCKGLAFTLSVPLVTVNSLDALAYNGRYWRGRVCAMIKARAEELYVAQYQSDAKRLQRCTDYKILDLNSISDYLTEETLIVSYPREIGLSLGGNKNVIVSETDSFPSPLAVAELGYTKLQNQETEDIESLEPFYLQDFKPKRKVYNYDSPLHTQPV